ncbi:MAG: DUF3822 family protein [Bacteroidia bacterium]
MTTEIKNKIIPVNSYVDEAFDASRTSGFQLILQIGLSSLEIAVNDKSQNKYIALEKYNFQNSYNFDAVADLLEIIFKESKLLDHKYQSVFCFIVNSLSTLVPNALYEDSRKKLYLKFNTSLEGDELVATDEIKNLDAQNIFAVPFSIKSKLDYQYKNITYHHSSSALINSLVAINKNQTGKKLYAHIQATHFETIVIDGKNLLFYNTFNHHTAEDFIYYLLFVCEQLQLNPEKIELIFLGEIERNSTIYAAAQKYIRNIKFGERTDGADYSYQLQTLPKHYYYTLFNNYIS